MVIQTGCVTCIHSYSVSKVRIGTLKSDVNLSCTHQQINLPPQHAFDNTCPENKNKNKNPQPYLVPVCREILLSPISKLSWSDPILLPTIFLHILHDLSFSPLGVFCTTVTRSKATYKKKLLTLCVKTKETLFSQAGRLFPSLQLRKIIHTPLLRNSPHSALYGDWLGCVYLDTREFTESSESLVPSTGPDTQWVLNKCLWKWKGKERIQCVDKHLIFKPQKHQQ